MFITLDDSFTILTAICRRALLDVRSGSPDQRRDAESFLTWICPTWREWPSRDQERAVTIAAQRRVAASPRRTAPADNVISR